MSSTYITWPRHGDRLFRLLEEQRFQAHPAILRLKTFNPKLNVKRSPRPKIPTWLSGDFSSSGHGNLELVEPPNL